MEEDIKILENIKDYMQDKINKGYHKFVYNYLGWDEKCIDVINAIEHLIERNKELEEENKKYPIQMNDEQYKKTIDNAQKELKEELERKINAREISEKFIEDNFISKSKVREKIEELEKEKEKDVIAFNKAIDNLRTHDIYTFDNRISVKLSIIEFLQELLED